MSTGRTEPAPAGGSRPGLVLALALVGATLVACGDDDPPTSPVDPEAAVVQGIERTLRQRARAITDGDPARFDRTLAQRDQGFVDDQDRYFDNLADLPLELVRFDVADSSLDPDGHGYTAEVTIRLQLQGYDVVPVITREHWRFVPSRDQHRYLVAATTDSNGTAAGRGQLQPWDLDEEIEVREGAGVLGIFDADTVGSATTVLDAVSEGRFEVKSVLPPDIADPGGVVVYAIGDPDLVRSIPGLPVSDPDRLDGATIPVPHDAADPDGRVASYRVVLSPHVLDESEDVVERLVRHELTHVAVGDRARGVPLWLNEGIAEYVSVQPIAPSARRLQTDALDLAAAGVDDLPPDDAFSGEDAEGWYAVSWWVCEYIARTYGPTALWTLLDGLRGGADQEDVIFDQLGISTSELAEDGVALMRNTYG